MIAPPPNRRSGASRRQPPIRATVPAPDPADTATLAAREAALLAIEQAARLRLEAADRREAAVDRRERAADRRERALLPREGAAQASARTVAQIRRVNERLVRTTVDAQARTEAAEQAAARLARVAQHDTLTGLPNRALLADRLERAVASAQGQGHRVALLFMDLDHFKDVNDTLGHPAGDLLLQSVARRLQACVRQTDTVCRQGGDEFIILLPLVLAADDAIRAAQKVIAAMEDPHLLGGGKVSVTVSIGISIFPDHGTDPEALVQAADTAMYEAKRNGRNNFRVSTQPPARRLGKGRRAPRK